MTFEGLQIPLRNFYSTPPTSCPYIPGREERKIITLLAGDDANFLHDALSQAGFRRSQDLAYRPACEGCDACVPVRVISGKFSPNRGQRRVLKANREVKARLLPAIALREHFDLFTRYLDTRHEDGGMSGMGFADYRSMVEDTPVDTHLTEYRLPDGRLYAVCLCDRMCDGLSLVYSFFDPDQARTSPGSFVILNQIERAQNAYLPYVYLGYWVSESPKMSYKTRFRPLEKLTRDGWRSLPEPTSPTCRSYRLSGE